MLEVFVPDALWLHEYPIRLGNGKLVLHSPCAFDDALAAEVSALGPVAAIVAPSNVHWLHVRSCQQAFPGVPTYVCPGVEQRAKDLAFDAVLDDTPRWPGELSQIAVQGTRVMREVVFLHHASRTLILVDLVENFTPATPGTNVILRALFRTLRMWKHPSPAPEYRFGGGDRARLRADLERILAWEFDRVILAHGDLITQHARDIVTRAWQKLLR